jgi:hypothetical protein
MALSSDDILLDNIKEALALYQRSLVWATTAALSGGLITLALRDPNAPPVALLSGTLSAPVAWAIAQALYVVFGSLAYAALRRYQAALEALNPPEDILKAIRMFPSFATLPGSFFRLGFVWLPLIVTIASWAVELLREHRSANATPLDMGWFFGLGIVATILVAPYAAILVCLRDLRTWQPRAKAASTETAVSRTL